MKTRSDCVVVFRDAVESRMRQKMDKCFEGLPVLPMVLVCDDPNLPEGIDITDRDYIISQNPENCSIWLRDDKTGRFRLSIKPGADSAALMSEFFSTKAMQRFADLCDTLEQMGIMSIEGVVSESEDEKVSDDKVVNIDVTGKYKGGEVSANLDSSQERIKKFVHDVKQTFKYSIDAPKSKSLPEMKKIAEEHGWAEEPIVKSVLNARELGIKAWKSLCVHQKISATVVQAVNEKIDFALSVCAKLPVGGGGIKTKIKHETDMMNKIIQGFEITVKNR